MSWDITSDQLNLEYSPKRHPRSHVDEFLGILIPLPYVDRRGGFRRTPLFPCDSNFLINFRQLLKSHNLTNEKQQNDATSQYLMLERWWSTQNI